MVSLHHKRPLFRFFWKIGNDPSGLLEGLQYLFLGFCLLLALVQFGGFVPYGLPMVDLTRALLALGALHGLVAVFRKKQPELRWEWLLPLPFLLWATFAVPLISPSSQAGWLVVLPLWQIYGLFFLLCNSLRGSRGVLWIIGIILAVGMVALLAGFFQYYLYPDWFTLLSRERPAFYGDGAAGFLLDPVNLGGLLILLLPLAAGVMRFNRFGGPARILAGFLFLASILGLFITTNRWGLSVTLGLLLVLPFLLIERPKNRWRTYQVSALILLLLAPAIWFGTDALQERLAFLMDFPEDSLGEASREVAMDGFGTAPFTGRGPGAYPYLWEQFRGAEVEGTSLYPVSLYGDLLVQTGLLGVVLFGFPLVLILGRSYAHWRETPFFRMKKEAEDRMKRMPKHRQRRARRHKDKKQGRVPLIKVVEGTFVPGMVAYLVYSVFDYGHRLPLHLMMLAVLGAVLATTRQWEHRHSARPRNRRGIALGLLPMLLFSLTALIAVPRYQSQHEAFLAGERLEAALLEPGRIFARPAILHETGNRYDRALRLNGGNSEAHRGKGEALLARYHADLQSNEDIAAAALPVLEEAARLNGADWKAMFALARALLMKGENPLRGLQTLETAYMRAPNRIEVMTLHGAMLLLDARYADQGVALLEQVLAREPDHPQAAELLNRYASGALADPSEEERRLSRQLLAARIGRVPILKERVLGAGRLHPDELLQQITTLSEDTF
jgi:hypothetical protein